MESSSETTDPTSATTTAHAAAPGLTRRPQQPPTADTGPRGPVPAGGPRGPVPARGPVIHGDIDPPPRARFGFQLLAVAAIVALCCLQFMPATHVRHPNDPRRQWIAINRNKSSIAEDAPAVVPAVDIFSWAGCFDLRMLAVLANSTLSGSSHQEGLFFHFFVPEGSDEQSSYHKLKVVLRNLSIEVVGQKGIKERLNVATPEGNFMWSFRNEIAPIVIAKTHLFTKNFLYFSPDTIVKGKIDDISSIDLGAYSIAAAEDCSKRLGDFVNMDVLNAVQRTAGKSWVSQEPYDKDACLPDFSVLLVDARKMERTLVESIMWWTKALNLPSERDQIRVAIALTFYNKYVKLPSSWKRSTASGNAANNETNILNYDGPRKVCSEDGHQQEEPGHGDTWQQYLPQKSVGILTHEQ